MMVTQRHTPFSNLFDRITDGLRSIYRFAGRIVLGGLALVAASIVALAMTFIGVLIAIAALVSRLMRGTARPVQARAEQSRQTQNEDGVILEARKTGHGWTVE